MGISGDPDLMMCMNGHFVALELKASGEKPRPLQERKLAKITMAGGTSLVASPNNWESIKTRLSKLDASTKEKNDHGDQSIVQGHKRF